MSRAPATRLLLLALAGCGEVVPAADAGPSADAGAPVLPACAEPGAFLTADAEGGAPRPFLAGEKLPVILGFQGFIFLQLGLRSPLPLPASLELRSGVVVGEQIDLATTHPAVPAAGSGTSWDTGLVLVYFNDVPLSDLLGRRARITLAGPAGACQVRAEAEVELGSP